MTISDLAANLLSPPVLFFLLGLAATLVRSDLEFPPAMAKALSLFLLFAIGFKGGIALASSGLSVEVLRTLGVAMIAAALVPLWTFLTLRRRLGVTDAAAVAATYGSVSAVTFIAATAFLTHRGITFSGHMVAAMALMESPAIIMGVYFARRFARNDSAGPAASWSHLSKDALLNGSVFLLLGSLLVGFVCGPVRGASLQPFVSLLFPGALALFLLDLGMVAAKRLGDLPKAGRTAVAFALLAPLGNGALGLGLGALAGLGQGDALLLVVLCASASYIAVPAALRIALPEANPGLYVTLALALTFPFNLVVGIPLYDLAVTAVGFN
jgi:uncharacterized protein